MATSVSAPRQAAEQPFMALPTREQALEWCRKLSNRTVPAMALARMGCEACMGIGHVRGRGNENRACDCVYRAVCRQCTAQYRRSRCQAETRHTALEHARAGAKGGSASPLIPRQQDGEYVADFELIAKRVLSAEQWRIFRMHVLEERLWHECAKRLNLSQGHFFHRLYRIETILGKAFMTTKPYALFPIAEYFRPPTRQSPRPAYRGRL